MRGENAILGGHIGWDMPPRARFDLAQRTALEQRDMEIQFRVGAVDRDRILDVHRAFVAFFEEGQHMPHGRGKFLCGSQPIEGEDEFVRFYDRGARQETFEVLAVIA